MMQFFSSQSKQQQAPVPLLSPHSATTNNGVVDDADRGYFFENGSDIQATANGNEDDDLAWLDSVFENEIETAKAMEAAKMNILTFTGSPPPTSPGYSSGDPLSPLTAASTLSASASASSSTAKSSKTSSPPPIIPISSVPIAGENPWGIELKTSFGDKYWRNDKRNLNCFPFCVEFGLDFRASKLKGLNHTRRPCLAPIDGSFIAPKDLQLRNIVLLGRFLMVSPQLCASDGRKLFHVGDIVQQSDIDAELNDCGVTGRISLVRDGGSSPNLLDIKITKPTVCDFEFLPKEWRLNVTLPKTRRKQNDSTSIPLYSFETLVLLITSPGQYILISRCISAPFQIASLRTLLREIAAKEGRSADTSSNSDVSVSANTTASKAKSQPKKKETSSANSQVSSANSVGAPSMSQSSASPAQSFSAGAAGLASNLTKRGHESGRNNDEDDTLLYFALDDQEIPQDLFSDQELFDLDKILDDVPPQDRKKVRTLFVQEAQKQKQQGKQTSFRNIAENSNVIITNKPQQVTNENHPLASDTVKTQSGSKPSASLTAPTSNASSQLDGTGVNVALIGAAAASASATASVSTPIVSSTLLAPSTIVSSGAAVTASSYSSSFTGSKMAQQSLDSEIVYDFNMQQQGISASSGGYNISSLSSKAPSAPSSSQIMIPIESIPVAEIATPLSSNQASSTNIPINTAQDRISFHTSNSGPRSQQYTIEDAYIFWLTLGIFGGHHYYLGRYGYGILYTLTMAGFGVGWIVDGFFMSSHVRRANSGSIDMIFPEFLFFYSPPFGLLGAHHYSINRMGFGLFYSFTFGGLGVGWVADMFRLGRLWKDYKSAHSMNAPPVYVTYSLDQHVYDARIVHMPLGLFGAHHFFLGNYQLGFIYLFTFGLLGVGFIADMFRMTSLVQASRANSGLVPPRVN